MVSESDVNRFAKENQAITKILENGKLQFIRTGMEFPSNTERQVLEAYAGGRAYRRAVWALENASYDFAQHEPYIVPHKHRNDHFLFCTLTRSTIPRRKESVEKHVAGKKFSRKLKEMESARKGRKHGQVFQSVEEETQETEEKKKRREDLGDETADTNDMDEAEDEGFERMNEEQEEEKEFQPMSVLNEMQTSRVYQNDREAAAERDMAEGDSVFWTRGPERDGRRANESDEIDDVSEWTKVPKSPIAIRASAKMSNSGKSTRGLDAGHARASLNGSSGPTGVISTTGKRRRSSKKPTKKLRRPSQRRKSGESQA